MYNWLLWTQRLEWKSETVASPTVYSYPVTPRIGLTYSRLNTQKLRVYTLKTNRYKNDCDDYERLVVTCITHPSLQPEFGTVKPVIKSKEIAELTLYEGVNYEIKIQTIFHDQLSEPKYINFTEAPALPALKITETNNDEEGYRSFIVQAHQPVTKSYYSSLNITCQPKELHVNLLSAQIECEIKGIDKDKRLFKLQSGLVYETTVQAVSFGKTSRIGPIWKITSASHPPKNVMLIPHAAPDEHKLDIQWTNVQHQFIDNTVIFCDRGCSQQKTKVSKNVESMTLTGLQGAHAYQFKLHTTSLANPELSEGTEWHKVSLFPPQDSYFNISHRYTGDMVGDGSFYFDVTLPTSKQTIRLNIIIQTEIFDGKNGFIKALNSTEFPSWIGIHNRFVITDRQINLRSPEYKQPGQRYQFNLFIKDDRNDGKITPGSTKNIIRTIVPSTPKNLTILNSPISPTLVAAWIIDKRSRLDEILMKVYTTGRLPNMTFTVKGDPSHFPSHHNISTQIFAQGVNYSFTVTAFSHGLKGLESQRSFLTTKTLCLHPEVTIGNLINQQEQLTWYFIDGRSYNLICPDGFKPPEEGTLWECSDGKWLKGSDCVPDTPQIFVIAGIFTGSLLIIVVILATIMAKASKKRGQVQTDIALEDETVAEKLQRHLSVSAVKRVVDDSLSTHHALSRHQSQSQGALIVRGRSASQAIINTAPRQSGRSRSLGRMSTRHHGSKGSKGRKSTGRRSHSHAKRSRKGSRSRSQGHLQPRESHIAPLNAGQSVASFGGLFIPQYG